MNELEAKITTIERLNKSKVSDAQRIGHILMGLPNHWKSTALQINATKDVTVAVAIEMLKVNEILMKKLNIKDTGDLKGLVAEGQSSKNRKFANYKGNTGRGFQGRKEQRFEANIERRDSKGNERSLRNNATHVGKLDT